MRELSSSEIEAISGRARAIFVSAILREGAGLITKAVLPETIPLDIPATTTT